MEAFTQHGAFSWAELVTTDVEGAKKFYTELLGWETVPAPVPDVDYTIVKAGGQMIGGIMQKPSQAADIPPYWGVYITVDNVDATVRKAEELGAKIMIPPTDIPKTGRFSLIRDPQGAMISFITYIPM